MKLRDVIEDTIQGDWGNKFSSQANSELVYCIRGADIEPVQHNDKKNIPKRYISNKSKSQRELEVGDLVVEKSGGSPTQSTGRIAFISRKMVEEQSVVCSNFCCALRIKKEWNPKYVYYFWRFLYNSGIFFNFEGKTSGLKNLQLDNALVSIEIPFVARAKQDEIADILSKIEEKISLNREINRNLSLRFNQYSSIHQ